MLLHCIIGSMSLIPYINTDSLYVGLKMSEASDVLHYGMA